MLAASCLSSDFPTHLYHLERFLRPITDVGRQLNLEKCLPSQAACNTWTHEQYRKTSHSYHCSRSTRLREGTRQLLFLVVLFRCLIRFFASVTAPLTQWLRGFTRLSTWSAARDHAFRTMRCLLSSPTAPFRFRGSPY